MKIHWVLCLFLAAGSLTPVLGEDSEIENTIVYVECRQSSGDVSKGTGVLVSADGLVLTARHVAPDGSVCSGSIAVAEPNAMKRLNILPGASSVDARMLKFAQGSFSFVSICKVEDWMIRKPIIAAGFPGTTKTGAASFRQGVLSTLATDPQGVIESDGLTLAGMSGGPVFSKNLAGIVGIVVGSEYDNGAEVAYYGILSANQIASDFHLTQSDGECFHRQRNVDLDLPVPIESWDPAEDGDLPLGVDSEEAICALSGIVGVLDHEDDRVELIIDDEGQYLLTGENSGFGHHGARVACLWLE